MTDATASRIGRVFYGLAVLGTGLQQLAIGQFVRIVPRPPLWIPAQPVLARSAECFSSRSAWHS